MGIGDFITVIFDVGCRSDSEFTNFNGGVRCFDPVGHFVGSLERVKNLNKASYFNSFGLGNETKQFIYL